MNMTNSVKRDRFKKVASYRVQKVISFLALLENCSNKNNYEYTESDINYMFDEIGKALKACKAAYNNDVGKIDSQTFSFKD